MLHMFQSGVSAAALLDLPLSPVGSPRGLQRVSRVAFDPAEHLPSPPVFAVREDHHADRVRRGVVVPGSLGGSWLRVGAERAEAEYGEGRGRPRLLFAQRPLPAADLRPT